MQAMYVWIYENAAKEYDSTLVLLLSQAASKPCKSKG